MGGLLDGLLDVFLDGILDFLLDGLLDSSLEGVYSSYCVVVQNNDNFILHDILSVKVLMLCGKNFVMKIADVCTMHDVDR